MSSSFSFKDFLRPLSNFFVCHNPFAAYPDFVEAQIYHDGRPKFFASVIAIDPAFPITPLDYGGDNVPFVYMLPDGRMKLYIILLDKTADKYSFKLIGSMQEAALWYCSFLNTSAWGGKDFAKQTGWNLLDNFNALTPGLQLINLADQKTLLLCYPQGIKTFSGRREMDEFMSKTLRYTDAQLARGSYNMIGAKGQLQK